MATDKDYTVIETGEGFEVREETSKVETFDGETLKEAIEYPFRYTVFLNLEAAQKSEDWPNANAVWKQLSIDSARSAKATAYQKATAKLREAKQATPEYRLEQFIKNAVGMGMERDNAEAFVAQTPAGIKLIAEIKAKG